MKRCWFLIVLLLIMNLPVRVMAAEPPTDGQYMIEVTLSGGSGRAQIVSPTKLTVTNGSVMAVVIWGSPYYEYMLVGGITYYPVNTDGNSTFEIPISPDKDMAVSARTVAMSNPHEIDYTLRFDSETIMPLSGEKVALPPHGIAAMTAAVFLLTATVLLIVVSKRRTMVYKSAEKKQELNK